MVQAFQIHLCIPWRRQLLFTSSLWYKHSKYICAFHGDDNYCSHHRYGTSIPNKSVHSMATITIVHIIVMVQAFQIHLCIPWRRQLLFTSSLWYKHSKYICAFHGDDNYCSHHRYGTSIPNTSVHSMATTTIVHIIVMVQAFHINLCIPWRRQLLFTSSLWYKHSKYICAFHGDDNYYSSHLYSTNIANQSANSMKSRTVAHIITVIILVTHPKRRQDSMTRVLCVSAEMGMSVVANTY